MGAQERLTPRIDVESLELDLLLEAMFQTYGFDFRQYSRPSIRRRLRRRMEAEGVHSLSALQDRVLHDPACMKRLVVDVSVNVSAMFRDPSFFRVFREKVVPVLGTYPFVRIWNAGCSTGEETYSLAILLEEHGLYDRSRIYATDMNDDVLERAEAGTFPLDKMQQYTANYIRGGGSQAFSEYYVVNGRSARFRPSLVRNVVFAQHNLVTDRSFNEFNVILCRNVMIYFDRALQDRVHELLYRSLMMFGVLGLGRQETLRLTQHAPCYEPLDETEKLYRRVR